MTDNVLLPSRTEESARKRVQGRLFSGLLIRGIKGKFGVKVDV